ncbi:MAG: hypothetical protein K0R07_268 [Sedimentibacter sp.]|jgi:uncharacterized membrane protein YgaE (UPF0421/DUF939 family)|nr:hypothetical protein [Sedimentibacter sp.]
MNFPRIGMRNIKTSTSVFLCLLFFEFLNRDNAVQACIAAIICMQNTIDDSFKKGLDRVIGTIIGGIVGAMVLFFIETYGHEQLLLFIIPLGIMILIEICVYLKLKQSIIICCVVYLSILITKQHEGGYIFYTFNRVVDTTLGIVITIFVNKYMNIPEGLRKVLVSKKFINEKNDIEESTTEVSEKLSENETLEGVSNIETNEKK